MRLSLMPRAIFFSPLYIYATHKNKLISKIKTSLTDLAQPGHVLSMLVKILVYPKKRFLQEKECVTTMYTSMLRVLPFSPFSFLQTMNYTVVGT